MIFKTTYWPSPAKINLFLNIIARKKNGYHELQTLIQFLDYSDTLAIKINRSNRIRVFSDIKKLKTTENLIWKSAMALKQYAKCNFGADIKIKKILPIAAGIGGGSSNAATILVALNFLWHLELTDNQLANIGLTLGTDIPVFVYGFSSFVEGIGEKLSPATPKEKWYLIVKPSVNIATVDIFTHPHLIRDTPKGEMISLLRGNYVNDCEKIVRILHPKVDKQLLWLLQYAPSRLTGTGSCIFSEFTYKKEAEAIFSKLSKNVSAFIAKGINISPLKETLAKYQSIYN
ncbi:4-diphosphocytidyl-2-C-methyl-D-erythritol kinase [Candidatus Photodesmus katoptron]|uniref:4-diphosphocytidyl-2-C-methyl-D-erythritol kinase n=2 Tax=Candidatus Photodesmus anomalopis TaxID=28176 RepID=S3EIE1_9GAMM|nr:4-(cytidine 5'-diphospho)-2-C-methyl-D-erythritol kinase [Candidatus Photodesmus katoptron Akat1]KEY90260.1 4-diphosphocytidyl-2-C-methyl-D-erythritol kinase [Candidatus Photodesmus katoptron]